MKTLMTLMLMTATLAAPAAYASATPAADQAIRDQGQRALAEIHHELHASVRPARSQAVLRHAIHGGTSFLTVIDPADAGVIRPGI